MELDGLAGSARFARMSFGVLKSGLGNDTISGARLMGPIVDI